MREDQQFLEQYKKSAEFEKVLQSINENLFIAETGLYKELPEEKSTIHIIGCPRSGTTLLNQLIGSCIDVGYINNLIAVFWKTPVHGIILSKKLIGIGYSSDYASDFGKTTSIAEPHEFTYFWNYVLNYNKIGQLPAEHDNNIDWNNLRLILTNMCNAFGTSIVFKSLFLGWHMQSALKVLHKTLFLFVERNILDNAWSLLQIRKKYFGTYDEWASIKPLQYEDLKKLNPYEQVIGQVYYLNQSYKQQLQNISTNNFISISYDELCSQPAKVLDNIVGKLEELGVKQNIIKMPPAFFKNERKINKEELMHLTKAYEFILENKFG